MRVLPSIETYHVLVVSKMIAYSILSKHAALGKISEVEPPSWTAILEAADRSAYSFSIKGYG